MGLPKWADELFAYDALNPSLELHGQLAERLKSLPKLELFLTVERYAELDFLTWDLEREPPSLGRYRKHSWMREMKGYLYEYGHVLPTRAVMDKLAELLRDSGPVLEVGCGSGYLSKELTRLGIETFVVDNGDPLMPIHKRDAQADAVPYVSAWFGVVMMTWPPFHEPFSLDVAKAMLPGQILVYEGENGGGCTASPEYFGYVGDERRWERLFDLSAKLDSVHVTFSMDKDHWMMYRRRDFNEE